MRPAGCGLIDQPIGVEQLRGCNPHRRTGRATEFDPWNAGDILSEVVEIDPGLGLSDLNRLEDLHALDGRSALGGQTTSRAFTDGRGQPLRVAIARLQPAGPLQPCVIVLTSEDARKHDRPLGPAPGFVGNDCGERAIGIVDPQLQNRFGRAMRAGELDVAPPFDIVHTIAQHEPQGIVALPELRGHIVTRIETRLPVIRPTGIEETVANLPPVQEQIVEPQSADVNDGAPNLFANSELLAKYGQRRRSGWGRRGARPLEPYPFRFPIRLV